MNAPANLRLRLANELQAQARREAADERLARKARPRHRQPLRWRVGRQIIAIGERLAPEPLEFAAPKGTLR